MKKLLLVVAVASAVSAGAADFVALYGAKPEQVAKELGAYVDPAAGLKQIKAENGTYHLQFNKAGRLDHFSYTLKQPVALAAAEKMLRADWGLGASLDAVKRLEAPKGYGWTDIPGKIRSIKLEKNGEGLITGIHVSYRIGWRET